MHTNDVPTNKVPVVVLLLGLGLPTLVTWIYFDLLATFPSAMQQAAYGFGKSFQFVLPFIVWWFWPRRDVDSTMINKSVIWGLVTGISIALAIVGLYLYLLLPSGLMDGPREAARIKLTQLGFNSPWMLVVVAVFYSLFHSGLEEYYWRWFVFRKLCDRISVAPAVIISSLGFMAHHVLVLAKFFGWGSPLTYLLSLGVATGGVIWAILYRQYGSLFGPWLSHLFVDAALFSIAYHLAFGS